MKIIQSYSFLFFLNWVDYLLQQTDKTCHVAFLIDNRPIVYSCKLFNSVSSFLWRVAWQEFTLLKIQTQLKCFLSVSFFPRSPSSHVVTYLFAKALYWSSLFILFRDSLPRTHPTALQPKPASKAVMSQSSLNCTNWTAFPVAINILSFQRRIGRQAEF